MSHRPSPLTDNIFAQHFPSLIQIDQEISFFKKKRARSLANQLKKEKEWREREAFRAILADVALKMLETSGADPKLAAALEGKLLDLLTRERELIDQDKHAEKKKRYPGRLTNVDVQTMRRYRHLWRNDT